MSPERFRVVLSICAILSTLAIMDSFAPKLVGLSLFIAVATAIAYGIWLLGRWLWAKLR